MILFINLDWGLPSNKRSELLGTLSLSNEDLKQTLNSGLKQRGIEEFDDTEEIFRSYLHFLVTPFAGDDTFLLKSFSNMDPSNFDFDPKFYMYGGGLIYPSAAFLKLLDTLEIVELKPSLEFYLLNPAKIGQIYYYLRVFLIFVSSIGICFFVYMVSKIQGNLFALLSWFLIMVMPVTHQVAKTIEPHLFTILPFSLSFYFTLSLNEKFCSKNIFLSAFFAGLSIGTQATSFYIIFAFFAVLYIHKKKSKINFTLALKYVILYSIVSSFSLILINPYYLLNFESFSENLQYGFGNQFGNSYKNWIFFQISVSLLFLFFLSLIYNYFFNRQNEFIFITLSASFPCIPIYVFLSNYHLPYVYCGCVLLCILSAATLFDLFERFYSKSKFRLCYLITILFITLFFPLTRSGYYLVNFHSLNQEKAGLWINSNIPIGSTIALKFPPTVWDSVPFNFKNFNLIEVSDLQGFENKKLPTYIVALNSNLHPKLIEKYNLVQSYTHSKFLGLSFEIRGELRSLIAKDIYIYKII